jgi:hypothetical protein
MRSILASSLFFLAVAVVPRPAFAVKSGELYTSAAYPYGRFEASIKFPAGDGVVGAFFLWKDGSEVEGTFWNELDFEKIGADCRLTSNAYYGNPAAVHSQTHTPSMLLCGSYHTYSYEWTPDYIAWFVDGMQLRRDTGATATAYAQNAAAGMQVRFNIWPGDASFGGNFNPSILPVYQEIDWVQYSSYANGTFTVQWRDDFNGTSLDPRWLLGTWDSPKGLSQHDVLNVGVGNGHAIIALTSDQGVGMGVPRPPQGGAGGMGGAAGTTGTGGAGNAGGSVSGGAGGGNVGGSSGAVSGGASAGGGAGAGGAVSGGASAGGADPAGGAVSGGASGSATGGSPSSGGTGAGGASGSPASGAPGSGSLGGSVSGASGNPSSTGSSAGSDPPSDGAGCTTSPRRPNGSGGLLVVALAALGAFWTRRVRRETRAVLRA